MADLFSVLAYIGPGIGHSSPWSTWLDQACVSVVMTIVVGALLGLAGALPGALWIGWYSARMAPRRFARRVTLRIGSTFPDALADHPR